MSGGPMAEWFDLTGKVAVVTGGSRGLGREMVVALAEAGADVVVASRDQAACEELASEVAQRTGRRALGVGLHVGRWDEFEAFVERVVSELGEIDVLINNAGMSP